MNKLGIKLIAYSGAPKEIFDKGDKIMELKRASLIGGKNAQRGKYSELIITNTLNDI